MCTVFLSNLSPTFLDREIMIVGPDTSKYFRVEFDSMLENCPIREGEIRHVTDLIGQFKRGLKSTMD